MRVKQRLAALAALALIVGAGCSSSSSSTTSSATTGPSGETRTVQVDGTPPNYVGAYLAFFPNAVTVHAGDTVSFKENWTGEPHTVTMGTLVETGLAAAGKADPNGPPPPEFASLPTMAPHGPGDFNQNGGQPCFLDTGAPPASAACPKASQPDFNGKQVYYNSGFLAKDATFSVKLAADIAPGTYHYYCNIHGPPMSGQIVVAPAATAIPAQDAVDAAGKTQRDAITAPLARPTSRGSAIPRCRPARSTSSCRA
jgi:plastocyanin